ncbi:unnamed protein product [Periconia digitata]|uniref:Uncharacterized protein n=1 Tax=Periconia digitata TaxID=1303443 RepID=A0A9W4UXA1_9PLEO|nr:unnamed protein product [Periconia digitata]
MHEILEAVEPAESCAPAALSNTNTVILENEESNPMSTTPTASTTPIITSTQTQDEYMYPPFTINDLKRDPKEPLFTEINIPLPSLPKKGPSTYAHLRTRAHSLQSLRPFHRRGSSSDSSTSKSSASRVAQEPSSVKSREVAAAMDLGKRHRRSRTIDALAVVPAVLVLRAELFTPVSKSSKLSRGEVKWEDGMI